MLAGKNGAQHRITNRRIVGNKLKIIQKSEVVRKFSSFFQLQNPISRPRTILENVRHSFGKVIV